MTASLLSFTVITWLIICPQVVTFYLLLWTSFYPPKSFFQCWHTSNARSRSILKTTSVMMEHRCYWSTSSNAAISDKCIQVISFVWHTTVKNIWVTLAVTEIFLHYSQDCSSIFLKWSQPLICLRLLAVGERKFFLVFMLKKYKLGTILNWKRLTFSWWSKFLEAKRV